MGDVITKFKLETTQYESKLRDSIKQMSEFSRQAALAGNEYGKFTQKNVEAAKALGGIATGATNAKDKVKELVNAYNTLAKEYENLSNTQKQTDFGKAMAQSLQQLQGRISDAKKELYSMKDTSGGLGSMLDSLAGKFGMSVSSLAGWGAALAAAKGAMDVAKDAFNANEASVDEWGRTVASVTGLYEGFLTALNTGDISGYISRMDDIAKAAQNVYNALDALGTMKTIQTPEMSERQTETERLRTMIRTGHYLAPENQQYATPGLNEGDKLTKEQIRTYEQELKNNMKELVQLNKNEIEQSTTAIDAIYEKMALQLGISLEEFREGTKNWAEFSKRMEGAKDYLEFEKTVNAPSMTSLYAHSVGATDKAQTYAVNPNEQYKAWSVFRVDKEGEGSYKELVNLIKQRDQQEMQTLQMRGQMYQTINRAEGFTVRKLLGGTGDGSTTKTQTELQQNEAAISKLTEEYQQLATAAKSADEAQRVGISERQTAIRAEIGTLQARNDELKRFAQEAKGISVNIGVNSSLPELTAHLQELQKAQSLALNAQEWQAYQQQIEQTNIQIDALKGKWKEGTEATFTAKVNAEQLEQLKASLPQDTTITVGTKAGDVELPDIPREITQIINTKIGEEVTPDIAEEVVQTISTRLGTIVTPEIERDLIQTINTRIGSIVTPNIADELTQVVNVKPGEVEVPEVPTDEEITIKADTAKAYAEIQKLVAGIEGTTVTFEVKPEVKTIDLHNAAGISSYMSELKKSLDTANFGTDAYVEISAKLADTSMLQSLVTESLKSGLGTALFDVADEAGRDFWARAMEGGVEDVDWQAIADKINEKRKEMDLKPIELDFTTGKTKEKKEEKSVFESGLQDTQKVVSGLSSVTSGLQQMGLKLPESVQQVLSGIQGAMSVIQGITSIMQVFSNTTATAQIAATSANTAMLAALTAAVSANTAALGVNSAMSVLLFAGGGIVPKAANGMIIPGNSLSGDNLRMPILDGGGFIGVNSQEVILNRAQAGNLASQLEGAAKQQGGGGTPYVSGEQIYLGLSNWGRRTGRGELVFSRG